MIRHTTLIALMAAATSPALAESVEVSFDGLQDGEIVNSIAGIDITVENPNPLGEDFARVFNYAGFPNFIPGGHQTPFSGGNAGDTLPLRGIAVGNDRSAIEGIRPGVDFTFDLNAPVTAFEFTIVDVEGPEEFQTDSGFFLDFLSEGVDIQRVFFGDLITETNPFFDSTIEFGNGFANTISFTAEALGVASFDRVELNLGGSATISRLAFTPAAPATAVPTPTAALAGLTGLVFAGMRRRRSA